MSDLQVSTQVPSKQSGARCETGPTGKLEMVAGGGFLHLPNYRFSSHDLLSWRIS